MPDFKFWDPEVAEAACDAPDYPEAARDAIREMHRQVGELTMDTKGIARRGLLIRHLVLPDKMAGTREIMHFIAREISVDTYVNIMPQYRPCGQAGQITGKMTGNMKEFDRYPAKSEFQTALQEAENEGIHRLDKPKRVFLAC